jgi:hypothetical protein
MNSLLAVDAHVGQHLFEECILRLRARNKCVVLVTNALQYLKLVDRIYVLKAGQIIEHGTYEQLLRPNVLSSQSTCVFADMMSAYLDSIADTNTALSSNATEPNDLESDMMVVSVTDDEEVINLPNNGKSTDAQTTQAEKTTTTSVPATGAGTLTTIEDREVGNVSIGVYKQWLTAAGGIYVGVLLIFLNYTAEAISVLASWWLSLWSQDISHASNWFYLGIYVVINIGVAAFMFIRDIYLRFKSVDAGKHLFYKLLYAVLYAPMSFFDTVIHINYFYTTAKTSKLDTTRKN